MKYLHFSEANNLEFFSHGLGLLPSYFFAVDFHFLLACVCGYDFPLKCE